MRASEERRRARLKHAEHDFAVGADGATVVVVADTHSRPHPDAFAVVAARKPDLILHAGDIGRLSVVEELSEIAETVAVRGNIDGKELPDSVLVRFARSGDAFVKLFLTHIAVRGPRLRKDVRLAAERYGAQLVVCGHSHVPLVATEGGVTVFNPGSIGPRRFALPITFGVMTISPKGVRVSHVDCETGERWLPPLPPGRGVE